MHWISYVIPFVVELDVVSRPLTVPILATAIQFYGITAPKRNMRFLANVVVAGLVEF